MRTTRSWYDKGRLYAWIIDVAIVGSPVAKLRPAQVAKLSHAQEYAPVLSKRCAIDVKAGRRTTKSAYAAAMSAKAQEVLITNAWSRLKGGAWVCEEL